MQCGSGAELRLDRPNSLTILTLWQHTRWTKYLWVQLLSVASSVLLAFARDSSFQTLGEEGGTYLSYFEVLSNPCHKTATIYTKLHRARSFNNMLYSYDCCGQSSTLSSVDLTCRTKTYFEGLCWGKKATGTLIEIICWGEIHISIDLPRPSMDLR